jgi:hypothetical protein
MDIFVGPQRIIYWPDFGPGGGGEGEEEEDPFNELYVILFSFTVMYYHECSFKIFYGEPRTIFKRKLWVLHYWNLDREHVVQEY